MTTWKLQVIMSPRGEPSLAILKTATIHSFDLSEADDVVGEAAAACRLAWPSMDLLRVMSCVPTSRGDELTSRGAA